MNVWHLSVPLSRPPCSSASFSHSMFGAGLPPEFCVCLVVTDPLTVLFGLKVCDDGAPTLYPASLPFHFLFAQLPFCLELWCVLSFICSCLIVHPRHGCGADSVSPQSKAPLQLAPSSWLTCTARCPLLGMAMACAVPWPTLLPVPLCVGAVVGSLDCCLACCGWGRPLLLPCRLAACTGWS